MPSSWWPFGPIGITEYSASVQITPSFALDAIRLDVPEKKGKYLLHHHFYVLLLHTKTVGSHLSTALIFSECFSVDTALDPFPEINENSGRRIQMVIPMCLVTRRHSEDCCRWIKEKTLTGHNSPFCMSQNFEIERQHGYNWNRNNSFNNITFLKAPLNMG